jgi:protein-S-isoprenylcysteine O-methyltransferase Ste14
VLGAVLYVGSRLFAPDEERTLATRFGPAWTRYADAVMLPWL